MTKFGLHAAWIFSTSAAIIAVLELGDGLLEQNWLDSGVCAVMLGAALWVAYWAGKRIKEARYERS